MKHGIHPEYRTVVFRDRAAGFSFLTRSTAAGGGAVERRNGTDHPVIDVEISAASHPFYTGRSRAIDTAGRLELFERRYGTARSRPAREAR
jgi:large subunit ribosomal protein L31